MQGLAYGLVNDLRGQVQQCPQTGGHGRPQVGDVVDLVRVQGDPPGQVDLDLVGGGHGPHQVAAGAADVLGDGQQGRDVVAGVGVLGGQERVVEVQFAHGHAVGPRRPFRGHLAPHRRSRVPPDRGPGEELVADRLSAGVGHRRPEQGGGGHAGVVDQAVDHHFSHGGFDGYRVGRQLGQLPGQLLRARQSFGAGVGADLVLSHPRLGCLRRRSSGIARNDTRHWLGDSAFARYPCCGPEDGRC